MVQSEAATTTAVTRSFVLRREAHAIAEFSASVQLFQPVNADTFARVVEQLREEAKRLRLPAAVAVPVLKLTLPGASSQDVPQSSVGYQRFAEDGEVCMSLLCSNNNVTLTMREYVSWKDSAPLIVRTFSALLKAYMTEVPALHSIKIQYLNEFRAENSAIISASELFSSGTKWIAPFALQANEDWHCNIGNFVDVHETMRKLVNVNCSVSRKSLETDELPRLYVGVLVLAGCFYNIPGQSPLILDQENLDVQLIEALDQAHDLEKQVLSEVISPNYLAAMGATNVH